MIDWRINISLLIKMLIKVLNVLFIIFLLFYLWMIVLPITACHFDGLRELLDIEDIGCYGESYDVGIRLLQFYGLLVLGNIIILLGLKFTARKWEKMNLEIKEN